MDNPLQKLWAGLAKIQADLDALWRFMKGSPSFGWAVVTAVNPLRIRYDGETAPVAGSPSGDTAGLQVGDRVWCQRINRRDIVLVNRGSGRPCAMASGVASPTTSSYATVTLPVGRFTQPPVVVAQVISTSGGWVSVPWIGANPTTTSFRVGIFTIAGAMVAGVVHWQAVQMTSSNASG